MRVLWWEQLRSIPALVGQECPTCILVFLKSLAGVASLAMSLRDLIAQVGIPLPKAFTHSALWRPRIVDEAALRTPSI